MINGIKMEMIQWVDHFSAQGWQDYPSEPVTDITATTVGFVVMEDKKYVVLAQTVATHACADLMHILKSDIIKRKKVTMPK